MRKPKFAGIFYEGSSDKLKKQLEDSFLGEKGPGELPGKRTGKVQAVITPHAGYVYSGMCAAWSYKAIGESEIPDLYIIFGPNHHAPVSGMSVESFETPLGIIRTDLEFAKTLEEKGTIGVNEKIHQLEHSVEVQIPFLQYANEKDIEKVKVLQILISTDIDIDQLAADLKETIMDLKKTVVYIVSSDFTHYGINYHYVPFVDNIQENLYKLDADAIEYIKKLDYKGFMGFVDEKEMTICGQLPIALLLRLVKSKKVELEAYYTSGDLSKNYRNSVSYASVIFR
ncbi:MAG: AmmeMemoRadiSam system protein B [Nanoarchaeota archaeon]